MIVKRNEVGTVGTRIRSLRLLRGLSQGELSSIGVSCPYISQIELGAEAPSKRTLRKLAGGLGVSVEYLETGVAAELLTGRERADLN